MTNFDNNYTVIFEIYLISGKYHAVSCLKVKSVYYILFIETLKIILIPAFIWEFL